MEDWRRFLDGIQTRSLGLKPGDVLFRIGEEARAIFHLERGRLRLSRETITICRVEPGTLFAEDALFAPLHSCDAIAEHPSRVEVFPKAAVLLHLSAHPRINLAFSAYLAGQIQTLRGQLAISRLNGARGRVIAYLTRMGAAEDSIRLDRPLVAVAEEIGLSHEALYRALAALKKDGRLIRPGRRLFRLIGP